MRIRSNSTVQTISTQEYERNLLTNAIQYDSLTHNVWGSDWVSEWMEDTVTPGWHQKMSTGVVVMNSMERFHSIMKATDVPKEYYLKRETLSGGVYTTTHHVHGWAETPWSAQKLINRIPIPYMTPEQRASELANYGVLEADGDATLAAALDRATSSDALALVTAAELDKTINLISDAASLIRRAADLLVGIGPNGTSRLNSLLKEFKARGYNRRGGYKRLRRDVGKNLASVASTWLAYRYGVMATYYDVKSWQEALTTRGRARFVAIANTEYVSDPGWTLQGSNDYRDHYSYVSRKRDTTIRAGVLINPEVITNFDRFGVNRILSSGWELVPFSFVVDWFVDIGTRISAFEGNLIVRPLGSWLTYDHVLWFSQGYDYRYDRNRTESSGAYYTCSGQNIGTVSETCTYRKRIPNPRLSVLPSVQVNLNGKKITDAVALLAVNSRRIRRSIRA